MNFIDYDELEESIGHLVPRRHLKDLYMMGNPAQQKWRRKKKNQNHQQQRGDEAAAAEEKEEEEDLFLYYVIHRLPQIHYLDGKEITRSLKIKAAQRFPVLEVCCLVSECVASFFLCWSCGR